MSMPEYIPTNLPQYITVNNRDDFSSAVVDSNHVLVFAESTGSGISLIAKNSSGDYEDLSGVNTDDATATSADIVSGKTAYAGGSKITGSIPNASITSSANIVSIASGYLSEGISVTVGTALSASTYTPGTTSQVIESGKYLTGNQTIEGDVNLVGSNIVSGKSIFGVDGTFAGEVLPEVIQPSPIVTLNSTTGVVSASYTPLAGKVVDTATKQSSLQLNTINASTYTPSTTSQVIAAGSYLVGSQTISGDVNLVGSNIVSGVSIFGVEGTAESGGGGITPIILSGSINDGAGNWYSSGSRSIYGISYDTGEYKIQSKDDISYSGDLTVCGWMCRINNNYGAAVILGTEYGPAGNENWIEMFSDKLIWGNGAEGPADSDHPDRQEAVISTPIPINEWHHFIMEYSTTTSKVKLIMDNTTSAVMNGTKSMVYNYSMPLGINGLPREPYAVAYAGAYSHIQVFSRLLTAEEKESLYNEFNI